MTEREPIAAEPEGVLLIHKHAGATSHDIVNRIRRLYGTRRVGHTGTLDPMATGMLVVLVGRAVKASEYLICDTKHYRALLRLGLTTDTEDTTGTVLSECDSLPDFATLETVLPEFRGKIQQVPPMYSALKVNGKKLVDLARQGVTVERQPREVGILSLKASPTDAPSDFLLDVQCTGGTYIRTLCADIGRRLGCGGVMAALCRTAVSGFSLEQAHTLDELEAMTTREREALLMPTESLFAELPAVRLSPFFEKLIRGGCSVAQKKLQISFPTGTRIRLLRETGSFFALGEAVEDAEQGGAVRAIKTFALQ